MMLIGLCVLNHEARKDPKKKYVAYLDTLQLDKVMDREEVAHHIVDSAVAIHTAYDPAETITRQPTNRIFFAVFVIFAVQFYCCY